MRVVIVLSAIVLSACSTQETAVNSPSVTEAEEFTIRCPGDWDDCYKQASNKCGNDGYREIGKQQADPIAIYNRPGVPDDGWDLSTGPADGFITFRCN